LAAAAGTSTCAPSTMAHARATTRRNSGSGTITSTRRPRRTGKASWGGMSCGSPTPSRRCPSRKPLTRNSGILRPKRGHRPSQHSRRGSSSRWATSSSCCSRSGAWCSSRSCSSPGTRWPSPSGSGQGSWPC
jgi:hypothetical protein